MSEPESDRDDPDSESMFDFLAEEGAEEQRRKKRSSAAGERSLPIIRKPVPVSRSGPLLPPKPGAPVEPPPALTDNSRVVEDDLDFLDETPDVRVAGRARRPGPQVSERDSNITRLNPRGRRGSAAPVQPGDERTRRVPKTTTFREDDGFDDLELDLDDDPEFDRPRRAGRGAVERDDFHDEKTSGRGRWLALVFALLLIVAGAGSFAYTYSPDLRALLADWGVPVDLFAGNSEVDSDSPLISTEEIDFSDDPVVASGPSPMMQRFREQLSRIEGMIEDGALEDAEKALSSMDRTVYGYGSSEFGALEQRIKQIRSGEAATPTEKPDAEQLAEAEAARLAEEQAEQAESARLFQAAQEAAREAEARAEQAREEQARAEQAREEQARAEQARAEQARAEQARADQVAREEQARIDAEQAEQAARVEAAEQAARDERDRAASDVAIAAEAARQEAARLEQLRQEQQAAQNARTSDWQSPDADRQATDRRIAEERAALQRQQAREQRLIEARERETAIAAQTQSQSLPSGTETEVEQESEVEVAALTPEADATTTQPIGDDELQTVYRKFIELQRAVSDRDINTVVSLTERSGVRVQQLMQIFENSSQIDARIRNVSTSNATGEIKGTLQISRIKRANGSFVAPPPALSSIPLSSTRENGGWSAIAW